MSQLRIYEKQSWRRRLGSLVLIGLGLYLIVVLSRSLWQVMGSWNRIKEAQQKVDDLKLDQAKLQRQLAVVDSDAFAEQQIRDQLMLAKPGETVVMLPPMEVGEGRKFSPPPKATEDTVPNWQKWARVFGFF